jgi:endonuclease YncB( thermonuclease family)
MRMIGYRFIMFAALYCLKASACLADTLDGRVIEVADGDTITVLDATNQKHKIRISGIDAPEKNQAFGDISKQSIARMVYGKPVQVVWYKRDRYGRLIGKVLTAQKSCRSVVCPKNLDAGLAQIAVGLAWHYKKYEREQEPADRDIYAKTEVSAREKKLGLWTNPFPVAPWDFRQKN